MSRNLLTTLQTVFEEYSKKKRFNVELLLEIILIYVWYAPEYIIFNFLLLIELIWLPGYNCSEPKS